MEITRPYIEEKVKFFKAVLGIEHEIKIRWTVESDDSVADTANEPQYEQHVIAFNLDKIKTKKDVRLAVIHELWHVVLSPYTKLAKNLRVKGTRRALSDAEEALVTRLENLKLWKYLDE